MVRRAVALGRFQRGAAEASTVSNSYPDDEIVRAIAGLRTKYPFDSMLMEICVLADRGLSLRKSERERAKRAKEKTGKPTDKQPRQCKSDACENIFEPRNKDQMYCSRPCATNGDKFVKQLIEQPEICWSCRMDLNVGDTGLWNRISNFLCCGKCAARSGESIEVAREIEAAAMRYRATEVKARAYHNQLSMTAKRIKL